ncbi:GGDEF domain-containing protein [uncultured Sphaerotilus sp.]|uniref:GGDEF domain-containing protein n=1 Tax=uncultured Sphaerotilus sp. TaxID=474984 RepID=UPI0030CA3CDA
MNSSITPVADWLLGPAGPQRWRVTQSLLALGAYAVLVLVLAWQWRLDLIRTRAALPLALAVLGCGLGFVAVMRSGLNLALHRRFGWEPSLTLAQSIAGLLGAVWVYMVAGPTRGAAMGMPVLVVVFAMFRLGPREALGLAAGALLLLGAASRWLTLTDSFHFPADVESVHLAYTTAVLAGVVLLAMRVSQLREQHHRQRAELQQALTRISELATRDELTGLPNRRAILDQLATETARHARKKLPLAIALIDLDHFKRINDAHGHAGGDQVLRGFAHRVESELRGGDVMARWGGEEFLLMLPDTSIEAAQQCLGRLRDRLRSTPFDEVAPGLLLTFSAGVTGCLGQGDIDSAIERADQAMYRAKEAGRDRTESS